MSALRGLASAAPGVTSEFGCKQRTDRGSVTRSSFARQRVSNDAAILGFRTSQRLAEPRSQIGNATRKHILRRKFKNHSMNNVQENGSFRVTGGVPLSGEIAPQGNKNEALPVLAAACLTDEAVTLENLPAIADVAVMLDILPGPRRGREPRGGPVCGAGGNGSAREFAGGPLHPAARGGHAGRAIAGAAGPGFPAQARWRPDRAAAAGHASARLAGSGRGGRSASRRL